MAEKFTPKCPKCSTQFSSPPKKWDCPSCNVKTWQPDDAVMVCQICGASSVGKFARHHCRQCGRVACADCSQQTIVIVEWSPTEKHRVCKMCAAPKVKPSKTGFLVKVGQRHAFIGEKCQSRYFELSGTTLMYAKERDAATFEHLDIAGGRVMDVAMHPRAFCIVGPRLQLGYVFSAESDDEKRSWMEAIERGLRGGQEIQNVAIATLSPRSQKSRRVGDFDVLTVLGFGRVMKVRERSTGNIYAMKVLDKQQFLEHEKITQAEKTILADMDHPFVVKIHDVLQTNRHLVLIMDFLCGGELFFHLRRTEQRRFSESRARFYAAEIGTALEYLHSRNIAYRDLTPENFVLDRDGHVVLTHFGLLKREENDVATPPTSGAPEYMSPERLENEPCTKASHWWTLGIVLFEMVAGHAPFRSPNASEMYDAMRHGSPRFPPHFGADLCGFLGGLLDRSPAGRLRAGAEFRGHGFFRGVDFAALERRAVAAEFAPDVAADDLRYFPRD